MESSLGAYASMSSNVKKKPWRSFAQIEREGRTP